MSQADQSAFDLLRALAKTLAPFVAEQLKESKHIEWIDQRESQLGKRRHINAVRRRMAANDPEARIVGRRHLLTSAAHEDELERIGARNVERTEENNERADSVAEELGLRLVGGKR